MEVFKPIAVQSIKYTHIFAHMNTIPSHLQRFSNKRPPWVGAINRGRHIFFQGALKRGWALNRGFTVCILYGVRITI